MNKVFQYMLVAAVRILLLLLMVAWIGSSSRDSLRKDCEKMGESRIGDLHIKCEVVPSTDKVPA